MDYYIEILAKFLLAITVGGLIGYERKIKNKPAGYITHTLVCVGACVIAIVQVNLIEDVKSFKQ